MERGAAPPLRMSLTESSPAEEAPQEERMRRGAAEIRLLSSNSARCGTDVDPEWKTIDGRNMRRKICGLCLKKV